MIMRSLRAAAPLFLLAAVLAAPASAQSPSRQTATAQFTDQRPAASSGLRISIDYRNPADRAAKPFGVASTIIRLAPGARIDTGVPARCTLDDADLMANGSRGCPGSSVVGSGTVTIATTDANPTATMDVTLINNANELIFLTQTQTTPSTRMVIRSPVRGNTITTDIPRLPGGPPDGVAAIRTVELRIGAQTKREGSNLLGYVTTPSACPSSNVFANSATFAYFDGVSQTVPSNSACIDTAPPKVRLTGPSRTRCLRGNLRARVRVTDTSSLRGVVVRLNGRRVKSTRKPRFGVGIRRARLRKGRNRLTVLAVDRRGNRFTLTRRVSRCR